MRIGAHIYLCLGTGVQDRVAATIKQQAFADVGAVAEETATAIVDQLIGTKVTETDAKAAVAAASAVKEA